MKELSLHILDILQNSVRAGATQIRVNIVENLDANLLSITVADNGAGIAPEKLGTVTDPFATTRTTRRVGLGLALLKAAAEQCNGGLTVHSEPGQGASVTARFEHDHLDRMPLGDMVSTLITFVVSHPEVAFQYQHRVNDRCFELDTEEITRELGEELAMTDLNVVNWMTNYVQANLDSLYEGISCNR